MRKNSMTCTIVIGLFLLAGLVGGCCVYQYVVNHNALEPRVVTKELERLSTIERISSPEYMVEYILQAAQTEDLDMALRGNPIDEMGLAVDTEKIIVQEECFYNELTVAPSAMYESYFPITSVELTGNFAEMFYAFKEELKSLGKLTIERVDYAKPNVQNTAEYRLKTQQLCDIWGAKKCYELSVLLSGRTGKYVAGFQVVYYEDYWKIMGYTSDLAETTKEDYIKPITDEEYQLFCNARGQKKLEEDWKKELEEEELDEIQKKDKEIRKLIDEGTALLPPNYFVINEAYGESPRRLMEKFILNLQKSDMTSMMNYGDMDRIVDRGHSTIELLMAQKNFAIQIKGFYFDLLREVSGEKEKSLSELGETASEIISNQNPENMFYLDLIEVNEMEQKDGWYKVTFWYGGDEYTVECKCIEKEMGWQIKEIGDIIR